MGKRFITFYAFIPFMRSQGSLEYLLILAAILAIAVVVVVVANQVLRPAKSAVFLQEDNYKASLHGIEFIAYAKPYEGLVTEAPRALIYKQEKYRLLENPVPMPEGSTGLFAFHSGHTFVEKDGFCLQSSNANECFAFLSPEIALFLDQCEEYNGTNPPQGLMYTDETGIHVVRLNELKPYHIGNYLEYNAGDCNGFQLMEVEQGGGFKPSTDDPNWANHGNCPRSWGDAEKLILQSLGPDDCVSKFCTRRLYMNNAKLEEFERAQYDVKRINETTPSFPDVQVYYFNLIDSLNTDSLLYKNPRRGVLGPTEWTTMDLAIPEGFDKRGDPEVIYYFGFAGFWNATYYFKNIVLVHPQGIYLKSTTSGEWYHYS